MEEKFREKKIKNENYGELEKLFAKYPLKCIYVYIYKRKSTSIYPSTLSTI